MRNQHVEGAMAGRSSLPRFALQLRSVRNCNPAATMSPEKFFENAGAGRWRFIWGGSAEC